MICKFFIVATGELDAYLENSLLLEKHILENDASPRLFDIDKSWDGIIYLLTGKNTSDNHHHLAKIIFSGQLIDEHQNLGYGPAHYLTPTQVKEIHHKIASIDSAFLRKHFNAEAMKQAGVYPNVWDYEGTDDYLVEYFETVQEVFATASQNNEAIIVFLTEEK